MSSKVDVKSFNELADRFDNLVHEQPDLSLEEAKKTITRLGAMGARLWHRSGIDLIEGFSPDRFSPKITHDAFKDEKIWWLTWQALVNVLATAYPHRIPGGVALSAGDAKLVEPGQDIPAYEISLPWERWKSLAQDFAGCCRLIDELPGRDTRKRNKAVETPGGSEKEPNAVEDEGKGDEEEEQAPALKQNELVTLKTLATFDPSRLVSSKDVENEMPPAGRLSPRTIQPAIRRLVELDLAERPEGDRCGARLTIKGRRFASKIAD